MNRVEALDRYSFSAVLHNPIKREGMPQSYEDRVLKGFIEGVKKSKRWGRPLVLDLASGIGKAATEMESAGLKTVRLDISLASLLANCGANVQAIFDDLPFKNESFDAIHFKDALVHVGNRGNLFKQLFRILKPGGELLIATEERASLSPIFKVRSKKSRRTYIHNFRDEDEFVEKLQRMKIRGKMEEKEIFPPYYPLWKSELNYELSNSGFRINYIFSWQPGVEEKDWYSDRTKRLIFSATKPK